MPKERFIKRSVIGLGITASLGLILWNALPNNEASNAVISSAPAASQELQPAVQSASVAKPATAAQQYLSIKEWGVDFPLPDGIKDAYYVPAIGGNVGDDGQPNMIWIGVASLDNKGCSIRSVASTKKYDPAVKPLGAILRLPPDGTNSYTGNTHKQDFPNGATIGRYYYAFDDYSGGNPCTSDELVKGKAPAFIESIKNPAARSRK